MRKLRLTCSLLSIALISNSNFGASLVVGNLATSTGNVFPFGGVYSIYPGTRYQQAYAASDFGGFGPISITNLNFFLQSGGNYGASTYNLYFSTITAGIDTLSNGAFDSNRGADNSFFASVTLGGSATNDLSITGQPFLYDSSMGNLLLDITVSPGGQHNLASFAANLDAPGVFSRYHDFGEVNIGAGLVTRFGYTPVPEPSTGILILIGVAGASLFRFRRHERPID